jgi:hypothetical protein
MPTITSYTTKCDLTRGNTHRIVQLDHVDVVAALGCA